ncbi:MAG: hypothetical protein KA792_03730 [Bacteroidales bacterium]|nr:hypothetical protein [Bacteroidales bacterium]
MNKALLFNILFQFVFFNYAVSQDDLMNLLDYDKDSNKELVAATFKTTHIVNGQSIEAPAKGELIFNISHRFGKINQGAYELFGLDQSTIRFGFDYSLNDRLSLGVGRSSFQKTYDGSLKFKILRQSASNSSPLSLVLFSSVALNTLKWQDNERKNYFSSRLAYTHQLLIARKFSSNFSLQLMPSLVHKNLVPLNEDNNDLYSTGIGGRYKLTKRLTVNAEYYYFPAGQIKGDFYSPISFGFDIDTGGHVFQLIVSNSQAMFERAMLTETSGRWSKGDIFIGFNLTRVFTIKKSKTA